MSAQELGIRWTIGDVSAQGFEALRLSVWGAWRLFGPAARYAVCVNTLPLAEAQRRTGALPAGVAWHPVVRAQVPAFLRARLDGGMSEGTSWKFAPLRVFTDVPEVALDNDLILWVEPPPMRAWRREADARACLVAEDVRACFGRFAPRCGEAPRNSGIRGIHPGFALEEALRAVLAEVEGPLTSELDEQGLQIAALALHRPPHVVRVEEVSICSPFPPHLPTPGRCGVHFVGLNAHRLPWDYDGRPATACTREHFARLRPALYERVGLPLPEDGGGEAGATQGPGVHP